MNTPANSKIETVLNYSCLLGEGPVWDAKQKTISWVDIVNGQIHEFSPTKQTHKILELGEMIGSIALCTDGNYIGALENGFAFINRQSGEIKRIADPESHLPKNRFNEGKCDPAGRFWAGTMALSEESGAGNLYVLNDQLIYSKKIDGVSISNGLAWSLDQNSLYYIDTPTMEVVRFDFDKESGSISGKKTIIRMEEKQGYPDGMTLDKEGNLWIAHWDGWQISQWDPISGKQIGQIRMPVARITSCTFGGEHYQDLYITSAKKGLSESELRKQPLAGSLFVIKNCGCEGIPPFEFIRHSL